MTRRGLIAGLSATGVLPLFSEAQTGSARIVVIGGGFGGATAARTMKALAPRLSVTLVEPRETYVACPFSNLVIGGMREIMDQGFRYTGVAATGVEVIRAR
ncbi:MAG: FAD-dependent oxidoreductase, partial [Pseudomonadota bacterium]